EKEITQIKDILAILSKCKVCRLGLVEGDRPYIIPLNYGFIWENEKLTLLFHSATEGKKLDIIKANNNACFEIDCDTMLKEGDTACDFAYAYKSVIGFGAIEYITGLKDKIFSLNTIIQHQTGKNTFYDFTEEQIKNVCIYKIICTSFTGKQNCFA
ncbi:MAG: pyridoxamine 5'-phosphate oxidase family protein, partial [Candidatus Cloacimonetes bacterium]|nr:pyridoxamine 5'-phosphate oxidase family protein [Candidatus Cloacimonadota bacterium]